MPLAGACRNQERVQIQYTDVRNQPSERRLEPHGLVHTGARWYLVAWDLDRDDWRTFRVDRIRSVEVDRRRFTPRPIPGGDLGAYVSEAVSVSPYPFCARVILHAPIETIALRIPPTVGKLEAIDAERCRLQSGGPGLESLALHIGMLGVDFEVEDPPELVDYLDALGKRLRRAARRSK
jgi:predicted DNA-binding transcriptional regulator YafY